MTPVLRRSAASLEALAALFLGAALAAAYAGALRFDLAAVTISVRNVSRPLLIAALILIARVAIPALRPADPARALWAIGARTGAGALIAASVLGWIAYLSPVVGGADSYGYVSASQRLLEGSLTRYEPLAALLPFPHAITAVCPLGYVAAANAVDACAPAYPLGLPLLMAIATMIGGVQGPFAVSIVMGVALLLGTSAVAWCWYRDRFAALVAAALVAMHPLVFTYSIQPMSDVPAAACFIAAVALLSPPAPHPLLAGLSAAIALAIRPALAPAIALLVVLPLMRDRAWKHGALYALFPGIAVVVQAASQQHLYGSALSSGYGSVADLFSIERLLINARSYGYWAIASTGAIALGACALGLAISGRVARVTVLVVSIGVGVPYLIYRSYDHWETLRFFLPAIVLLTIVAAAGVVFVCRRLAGASIGAALAVTMVAAIGWTWHGWLVTQGVFAMPAHEARHRLAAELAERATPQDAVVLALQHSGSLRYYARRETINWDVIPAGQLRPTVAALQRHGRRVYVMTDSDEERVQFRRRHGAVLDEDRWLPAGQRRNVQLYEAPDGRR